MNKRVLKSLEIYGLKLLRGLGRLTILAPEAPRATGGYGLAFRGGLVLLFLIGLVLSWPARGPGLAIMVVAGVAMMQFFVLQYRGVMTRRGPALWLAAVAVALGVVVLAVWSTWSGGDGTAGDMTVLAALIGSLALLPLVRVLFREIFGPHHPESPMPEPGDPPSLWYWVGGVGPSEATLIARVDDGEIDSLVVDYDNGINSNEPLVAEPDGDRFCRLHLTGLEPDTRYQLRLRAFSGGDPRGGERGEFTTFPPPLAQSDICLAFASCMSTGSRGRVFDAIRETVPQPQAFVITGDLHYENITVDRVERYLQAYDKVHSSYPQRRLYSQTPIAYVWDDHDFGDNDSDHRSPSKESAQAAYRLAVPSYLDPDQDRTGSINQEFSIGRVRVVMTDNRSERNQEPGNLLSAAQEDWLVERITDRSRPLVIWVSSTPWISPENTSDNWGGYASQRRRIAEKIGDRNRNLISVSGDAHMVAIDDGTNTGYAGPGTGFPVLNAAALDRRGSQKGAEFSGGKFPGAGQFGIVTILDRGEQIHVELSGRLWTGAVIAKHSFTVTVGRDRQAVVTKAATTTETE